MKKLVIVIVLMFAGICIAPTYKFNIGVCENDTAVTVIGYRMNIGVDQTDVPYTAPETPSGGGGMMYLNPILLGENW